MAEVHREMDTGSGLQVRRCFVKGLGKTPGPFFIQIVF